MPKRSVKDFGQALDEFLRESAQAAIKEILSLIHSEVSKYPPETIANRPENPSRRWYERGYGPRWWKQSHAPIKAGKKKIKQLAKKGVVGGRRTSEQLGKQWHGFIDVSKNDVVGRLENRASYSGYVVGFVHDEPKQSQVMAKIGWPSIETVVEKNDKKIDDILDKYVDKALEQLVKD